MTTIKNENIRVLLVDDSPFTLAMLTKILSVPGTGINVVGTAIDGAEALLKIPKLDPQVICTDLQMPYMNGLELTRKVMATCPRPILVLSGAVESGKKDDNSFQLLEAGAIDIMPKSKGNMTEIGKELIEKIHILSTVKIDASHSGSTDSESLNLAAPATDLASLIIPKSTKVIAIGASTGGPHALHTILSNLPAHLPVPVVCFQHVSQGFTQDLVDWLDVACPLTVRIAQEGEPLIPGTVYFPPDDKDLMLDANGCVIAASSDLGALTRHPSITIGFNSIASYYGSSTVGILLTGMGEDGTDGLLNIRKAGGLTIAEAESSCVVYGMPKIAADIGAVQHVLTLDQISKILGNV